MEVPLFRIIFHIDLNAFFAACEMVARPELKTKPVVITGAKSSKRGIVVTANYPAREYGIHSGMPIHEAMKRYPKVTVLKSNFDLYKAVSSQFIHILHRYTKNIEKASIDEAYLDVTSLYHNQNPILLAQEIQKTIYEELQIGCSIGIAPNKFLAKMASDMLKPNGITVLRKRDIETMLWPIKIEDMYGVGKASAPKLKQLGIETIKDLATYENPTQIEEMFGKQGKKWVERAQGIDESPVDPERYEQVSSIGHSTTFPRDYHYESEIKIGLQKMCEKTFTRIKQHKLYPKTVTVQIRYPNFKTINRSLTMDEPIHKYNRLFEIAENLFDEHWNGEPVRLIGVSTTNFSTHKQTTKQLNLFNFESYTHEEPLNKTLLKLQNKHGEFIVKKGFNKK